jgi:recombination protein RecA
MVRRLTIVLGLLASPPVASFVVTQTKSSPLSAALLAKAASTRKSGSGNSNNKPPNSTNPPPPMDPAKQAALDGVLNQIERLYGRGSIVKLGDAESMRISCIGSGSLTLDAAIGGGYPKGRYVFLYGLPVRPVAASSSVLTRWRKAEAPVRKKDP